MIHFSSYLLSLFCRDSDGGRGSVVNRGSKHDSKHDSTLLGNVRSSEDIRRISIELPQPMLPRASIGPAGSDRVRNGICYMCLCSTNSLHFCDIFLFHLKSRLYSKN